MTAPVINAGMLFSVEYVDEVTFATTPSNPTMGWIGIVTRFNPIDRPVSQTKKYFKAVDGTNRAEANVSAQVGYEVGCDIEFIPQTGHLTDFLKYWLGGTAAIADTIDYSCTIGMITNSTTPYYRLFKGLKGERFTLSVPEKDFVRISGNMVGADVADPTTADYKGSGSHASELDADPLTADDLTSVQFSVDDGSNWTSYTDIVKELTLSISNKIVYPTNLASTHKTKIDQVVLTSRDITIGLSMDYDGISTMEYIRDFTEFQVRFTLDGHVFTLTGVRFPEMPYPISPEDVIGDRIESYPVTGMSWT